MKNTSNTKVAMVLVERKPTWRARERPRLWKEVKEYITKETANSKAQELLQFLASS